MKERIIEAKHEAIKALFENELFDLNYFFNQLCFSDRIDFYLHKKIYEESIFIFVLVSTKYYSENINKFAFLSYNYESKILSRFTSDKPANSIQIEKEDDYHVELDEHNMLEEQMSVIKDPEFIKKLTKSNLFFKINIE